LRFLYENEGISIKSLYVSRDRMQAMYIVPNL